MTERTVNDRRLSGRRRRAGPPLVAGAFAGDRSALRDREHSRRAEEAGPDAATLDGRAGRGRGRPGRGGRGGRSVPRGWSSGRERSKPGNYTFSVGTAGSATLVLQTVLPALLVAEGESNLVLEGGTHNPMAPPFDFLARPIFPWSTGWVRRSRPNWSGRGSIRRAAGGWRSASADAAIPPLGTSRARRDHRPPSPRLGGQLAAAHRRAASAGPSPRRPAGTKAASPSKK